MKNNNFFMAPTIVHLFLSFIILWESSHSQPYVNLSIMQTAICRVASSIRLIGFLIRLLKRGPVWWTKPSRPIFPRPFHSFTICLLFSKMSIILTWAFKQHLVKDLMVSNYPHGPIIPLTLSIWWGDVCKGIKWLIKWLC